MMNIQDVVGRCPADQTGELLSAAWDAATNEQQSDFALAHKAELTDLLGIE